MGTGRTTGWMVGVVLRGRMVESMKGNIWKVKKMDLEFFIGKFFFY